MDAIVRTSMCFWRKIETASVSANSLIGSNWRWASSDSDVEMKKYVAWLCEVGSEATEQQQGGSISPEFVY